MVIVAACSQPMARGVASGADAYKVIPAANPSAAVEEYRIGPLDTLDITVFQEPDLSLKNVRVDVGGSVVMPLIGKIQASGMTANTLADLIATQLKQKYLEDPRVAVGLVSSVSQRVTVEGSVNEAGVFAIQGRTTLLEALAMAKGTSRIAALNEVVVFRTVGDKRSAAVFNVTDIRRGSAPDPEIIGNDLVVVGFSNLKAGWRDFLSTVPLLNAFRPFY